jgi:hypothetical protein
MGGEGVVYFTDVLWVVVGLNEEGEGDRGWVGGVAAEFGIS